jgi:uncharacterized membrane protein
MRPRLRAVLFVSLALNLAGLGVVAGALLQGPERGRGHDPVAPYTRALDEAQRRALGAEMRQRFRAERAEAGRPDVPAEYRAALAALRAEPFDAEAFAAILAEQGRRADARRQRGEAVLLEHVTGLEPSERAAYAARLEAVLADFEARFARAGHRPGGRD